MYLELAWNFRADDPLFPAMMDSKAFDQIFLILPDGREVIGRALQVNDPIRIPSGSGQIDAKFKITVPNAMEVAAVLMMLDKPMRERIRL